MIIKKTLGGTLYMDDTKSKSVWLCNTINGGFSVFVYGNELKTRKVFTDNGDAMLYATHLVQGE